MNEDYSAPLEAGDRVTLELDLDKGNLSFYRSVLLYVYMFVNIHTNVLMGESLFLQVCSTFIRLYVCQYIHKIINEQDTYVLRCYLVLMYINIFKIIYVYTHTHIHIHTCTQTY